MVGGLRMNIQETQKNLIEDFLSIEITTEKKVIDDMFKKFDDYIFNTDKNHQKNEYDIYIGDFFNLLRLYKQAMKQNKHFDTGSVIVASVLARIEKLDNYQIYDAVIASRAIIRVRDYKKACMMADTIIQKSEAYKDDPLYNNIKESTYFNVIMAILNTKFLPENTWETDREVKKVFLERVEIAKEYFYETDNNIMLNLVEIFQHLGTGEQSLARFYLKSLKEVTTEEHYTRVRNLYFDHLSYFEVVKEERELRKRKKEYEDLTKNHENAEDYLYALGSILNCKHTGTEKQLDFLLKDFSLNLNLTEEQLLYLSDKHEEEVSEDKFKRKILNSLFKFEHLKLPNI